MKILPPRCSEHMTQRMEHPYLHTALFGRPAGQLVQLTLLSNTFKSDRTDFWMRALGDIALLLRFLKKHLCTNGLAVKWGF